MPALMRAEKGVKEERQRSSLSSSDWNCCRDNMLREESGVRASATLCESQLLLNRQAAIS